jgi:aspartyl/asparaginyl beta-hydroxylase (cupin superfamily)
MFLDTTAFPFTRALESSWLDILDECRALPRDCFEPWVQREMYGEGWSVYGLVAFGHRLEAALDACPKTARALAAVPGLTTAGFSRMAPGTHITPHVGWVKTVYRLHLGLEVPPDCALRVGTETRSWKPGQCLVFDDTVEHEAWNRSTETRTVLLLDFLRPGVDPAQVDVPPAAVAEAIRKKMG